MKRTAQSRVLLGFIAQKGSQCRSGDARYRHVGLWSVMFQVAAVAKLRHGLSLAVRQFQIQMLRLQGYEY
jgi:hypothetical protein